MAERRRKIKRFFSVFLPFLVFLIALGSPGGEYVFKAGDPASVKPGSVPRYVTVEGLIFHLYSSPYGPWEYPGLIEVAVNFPTTVYITTNCPFFLPTYLQGPRLYRLNITVPPGLEGSCVANFTHPYGWKRSVQFIVKQVDWYPGTDRRAVVELGGRGWQWLQISNTGVLYSWELPLGRLPLAGCAVVVNKSLLMAQLDRYGAVDPKVRLGGGPPLWPMGSGEERYGFIVKTPAVLYVYPAPCVERGAASPPDLNFTAVLRRFNVLLAGLRDELGRYYIDLPSWNLIYNYTGSLRRVYIFKGVGGRETAYLYAYSLPVRMWGLAYYANFTAGPELTRDFIWFGEAAPVNKSDGFWVFTNITWRFFYLGAEEPYRRNASLPFGVPIGWKGPIVVVADGTGEWGGLPRVISVRVEELGPWSGR